MEENYNMENESSENIYEEWMDKNTWNNSPYASNEASVTYGNGLGIISMVLGIFSVISLILCIIPVFFWLPLSFSFPGLVLGKIGHKRCPKAGYTQAGMILSIISIILVFIILVFVAAFISTGAVEEMLNGIEYSAYI